MTSKALFSATVAATTLLLAACGGGADDTPDAASGAEIETTAALATAETLIAGTFEGRSDHITTGGVKLVKDGESYALVFAEDFSLDGAPDPVVGFGADGVYVAESVIGDLKALTGAQSYALPADFDPSAYNEAYVWCGEFAVPLGVASLS